MNVHVLSPQHGADRDRPDARFRDWLRCARRRPRPVCRGQGRARHPRRGATVQDYADAKSEVVEQILAAGGSGAAVGPSRARRSIPAGAGAGRRRWGPARAGSPGSRTSSARARVARSSPPGSSSRSAGRADPTGRGRSAPRPSGGCRCSTARRGGATGRAGLGPGDQRARGLPRVDLGCGGSRARAREEERLAGPQRADAGQVALVEQGGPDGVARRPAGWPAPSAGPSRARAGRGRGARRRCPRRWSARLRAGRGAARARSRSRCRRRPAGRRGAASARCPRGDSTRHCPSILQVRVQGDAGVEPVQQVLAAADHLERAWRRAGPASPDWGSAGR